MPAASIRATQPSCDNGIMIRAGAQCSVGSILLACLLVGHGEIEERKNASGKHCKRAGAVACPSETRATRQNSLPPHLILCIHVRKRVPQQQVDHSNIPTPGRHHQGREPIHGPPIWVSVWLLEQEVHHGCAPHERCLHLQPRCTHTQGAWRSGTLCYFTHFFWGCPNI